MKTAQHIRAGGTTSTNFRGIALPTDPFLDFEVETIKPPPRGVVQDLLDGSRGASMSLGTPRLCNDRSTSVPGFTYPVACIEWNRVTFYREAKVKPRDPNLSPPGAQNLTRGIFNGYMSPATKRKFRRIASTWLRSIMLYRREVKRRWDPGRAYPTLITLTIPVKQEHSDREIYRACLMPWIQMMRRDYGVEQYVWRAEAQENGNLHYHLIVDRYIPKRSITLSWNQCLDNLDYRTRYFIQTGSAVPPSTEVHALKEKVRDPKTGVWRDVDPVDYLVDYLLDVPIEEPVTDKEGNTEPQPRKLIGFYRDANGKRCQYTTRPITGRVWGMSDALREIKEPKARGSVQLINALESARDAGELRRIDLEHATMYFGRVSVALGRSHPGAWAVIKEYYLQIFGHVYPNQLPPEHTKRFPPMDPRGLWIDLDNFSFYYPESREEQIDRYHEENPTDDRLQVRWGQGSGYLVPTAEHSYKTQRIRRKMERLGIRELHQRWIVKEKPVLS